MEGFPAARDKALAGTTPPPTEVLGNAPSPTQPRLQEKKGLLSPAHCGHVRPHGKGQLLGPLTLVEARTAWASTLACELLFVMLFMSHTQNYAHTQTGKEEVTGAAVADLGRGVG